MKKIKILYAPAVLTAINKLSPLIKRGIRNAIDEMREEPYIGKPLSDELLGLYSHRFKRYRVIYRHLVKEKRIEIISVGHRYNVYDLLSERVRKQ